MLDGQPLSDSQEGRFRCIALDAEGDDAIRLKRLGLCDHRDLEVVLAGDPMILQVSGTRIGVSRSLASLVRVRRAETSHHTPSDAAPDRLG